MAVCVCVHVVVPHVFTRSKQDEKTPVKGWCFASPHLFRVWIHTAFDGWWIGKYLNILGKNFTNLHIIFSSPKSLACL